MIRGKQIKRVKIKTWKHVFIEKISALFRHPILFFTKEEIENIMKDMEQEIKKIDAWIISPDSNYASNIYFFSKDGQSLLLKQELFRFKRLYERGNYNWKLGKYEEVV